MDTLSIEDMTLKFHHCAEAATALGEQVRVWQTPGGSLYRVIVKGAYPTPTDGAITYAVQTLVSTGWIDLITLIDGFDEVHGARSALALWLRIQNLQEA